MQIVSITLNKPVMKETANQLYMRAVDLRNRPDDNGKELLNEIESEIIRLSSIHPHGEEEVHVARMNALAILFDARKLVMNRMFTLTQSTYLELRDINEKLNELTLQSIQKMKRLHDQWKADADEDWMNDCQMSTYFFTDGFDTRPDETGSDYKQVLSILETVSESFLEFMDSCGPHFGSHLSLYMDSDIQFSTMEKVPWGDFGTCIAFRRLYRESLLSHQDILRIKHFWANVSVIHQRIINRKGELV